MILWNAASGEKLRTFDITQPDDKLLAIALTPDGKWLAMCSRAGTATVWDVARSAMVLDGSGTDRPARFGIQPAARGFDSAPLIVQSAAISPDASKLAISTRWQNSGAEHFVVWEPASGKIVMHFSERVEPHGGQFVASPLAISSDGKQLLIGARRWVEVPEQSRALLVDLTSPERSFVGKSVATAVAFGPDSKFALIGSLGGTVELVDVAGTASPLVYKAEIGAITSVSFRAESKQILAASENGSAVLFDTATQKKVRTLAWPKEQIRSVVFGPDWKRILFVSPDDALTLWDIEAGKELARVMLVNGGKDIVTYTPDGLFDGSEGGREKLMFRTDGRLNVVPAREFEKDLYRPALLAALLRGDAPPPPAGKK